MEGNRTYRYAGVPVRFPYVPYRAQNALMHAIVTASNSKGHALLESPTGTGKSLALLCGALAWQENIAERIEKRTVERAKAAEAALHVAPPPDAMNGVSVPMPVKSDCKPACAGSCADSSTQQQQLQELQRPLQHQQTPQKQEKRTPQKDQKQRARSTPSKASGEKVVKSEFAKRAERQHGSSTVKKEVKEEPKAIGKDIDDFQNDMKFRDVAWQKHAKIKRPRSPHDPNEFIANPQTAAALEALVLDAPLDTQAEDGDSNDDDEDGVPKRVPRIFYATRTHNQVAQIVSELRKTSYRPAMTVLASRKEYCIREEVVTLSNRNEVCRGLVKKGMCYQHRNVQHLVAEPELKGHVWDIEELSNIGKRHKGCPYYASNELYKQARIIFCPYNYIVDKNVRQASGIDIKGDILVFDEAHNIEDFSRESASFSVDIAELHQIVDELRDIVADHKHGSAKGDFVLAASEIIQMFANILQLVETILAGRLEQNFDYEYSLHEGQILFDILSDHGITKESIVGCETSITLIRELYDNEDDEKEKEEKPEEEATKVKAESTQSQLTQSTIGFGFGYGYTAQKGKKGSSRNSAALARKRRRKRRGIHSASAEDEEEDENVPKSLSTCLGTASMLVQSFQFYFSSTKDFSLVLDRRTKDFRITCTLHLWCLNAAVAFREISSLARSVIVTSGTLSPLDSFAGELGTDFKVAKTMPHVIDVRRQLYVGVVARGPDNTLFDGTFSGSSTFDFQDSLGEALLQYCGVIPSGVLVFLPSYRMLNKLKARWEISGLLQRLGETKSGVYFEPSRRGEEFDRMMTHYTKRAASPGGALLFGVCRGKLAEGIDFKDEMARAVVVVGIPFPHKGDLQVVRKIAWNNRARIVDKRSDVMPGSKWYETQAYRALNQALGRSIRHKLDYGAILLIDHRYRNPDVIRQLPGWTKAAVHQGRGGHEQVMDGLRGFFGQIQNTMASVAGVAGT